MLPNTVLMRNMLVLLELQVTISVFIGNLHGQNWEICFHQYILKLQTSWLSFSLLPKLLTWDKHEDSEVKLKKQIDILQKKEPLKKKVQPITFTQFPFSGRPAHMQSSKCHFNMLCACTHSLHIFKLIDSTVFTGSPTLYFSSVVFCHSWGTGTTLHFFSQIHSNPYKIMVYVIFSIQYK